MSFLDRPFDSTRTARTSRDICRDSAAIELPDPPDRSGHRFIPAACLLAGLVVIVIIAMEKFT